jgi:hypothetical protein
MALSQLPELTLSNSAMSVLEAAERSGRLTLVGSVEELVELAVPRDHCDPQGYFTVGYDVPGRGYVPEARVCRVRNGIAANYIEPYMRRRDPDCMVIADDSATDKPTFKGRFGEEFAPLRNETLEWLKTQPLACFFFETGLPGFALNASGDLSGQCRVLWAWVGDAARHCAVGKDSPNGVRLLPRCGRLYRPGLSAHSLRRQAGGRAQPTV